MARQPETPSTPEAHRKAATRLLQGLAPRHGLWKVVRDFVGMSANAFLVRTMPSKAERAEADYMEHVKPYTSEEATDMARCLAHVVMGLRLHPHDFLGQMFMELELGNEWRGQFFTPSSLCLLMAALTVPAEHATKLIETRGFVRVSDPCIGAGAMVIAIAEQLRSAGHDPRQNLHVVGQDIDLLALQMAYIQLSVLEIPAVLVLGNTLTLECRDQWATAAHFGRQWPTDPELGDVTPVPARAASRPPLEEGGPVPRKAPQLTLF